MGGVGDGTFVIVSIIKINTNNKINYGRWGATESALAKLR